MAQSSNSPWNAAFGALGNIGGMAAGGYFSGLNKPPAPCWIAAELYGGWHEPRTVIIRHWLQHYFSSHWIGQKIVNLYAKYGERTAHLIRIYPALRMVFLPIFSLALRQAKGAIYAR
jgi:hypothetical protein